jgi:nitrilase
MSRTDAYIDNALVMGSEQWGRLVKAIVSASIWTALTFAEREGDHMYMSQAFISPAGATVHHRRKLRPSGSERDVFSDGKVEDIKVVETELGRVGMLQCGE